MAKSKYDTHVIPQLDAISTWAKNGATTKEVASKLGIAYSTFRNYLNAGKAGDERYSALSASFTRACVRPDAEVTAALFRKTQGYNAQIKKHYKVKRIQFDAQTGKKVAEIEELVEVFDEVHVPADTTAQMFWLTNRIPEEWKYKRTVDVANGILGAVNVQSMTISDKLALIADATSKMDALSGGDGDGG